MKQGSFVSFLVFILFGQLSYSQTPFGFFKKRQSLPPLTVKQAFLGGNFGCALLSNDKVKCWGNGTYGRLGQSSTANIGDGPGEMGNALPFVNLGTGRTVKQIASTRDSVCAILDNDSLRCWGSNSNGEALIGTSVGGLSSIGDVAGEMGDSMNTSNYGSGVLPVQITGGTEHFCARFNTGQVKCWGGSTNGNLGFVAPDIRCGDEPSEIGDNLPFIDLGTGLTAKFIEAGNNNTCAILNDDTLKCWGDNTYGQLGLGDVNHRGDSAGEMGDALPRVNLGAGIKVKKVAIGGSSSSRVFMCAILLSGDVKCWGKNDAGNLGYDDLIDRDGITGAIGDSLANVNLGGLTAIDIAAGTEQVCVLLSDYSVKCWGDNVWGVLGTGSSTDYGGTAGSMSSLPRVNLGTGVLGKNVYANEGRYGNSCVLTDANQLKCFGRNSSGSLGLGTTESIGDAASEMGNNLKSIDFGTGP